MVQTDISKLPNILSYIDPNLPHADWFKVLAGVKSEFGDAGKEYALDWSQSGVSFDITSFKSSWSSVSSSKITFGTVIHYAKEGGYQPEVSEVKPLSNVEIEKRKARQQALAQAEEAEMAIKHQSAAETAKELYSRAKPVVTHSYLAKKGIPVDVFVQLEDNLIIPVYKNDELVNIQEISPDGTKKFLYGGEISGCYWEYASVSNPEVVFVCEGVATGVSLNMATGKPVVIAFNSGNLPKVTKAIADKYPKAGILVCGDNDQYKEKNAGLEASQKAITGIKSSHFVLPDFEDTSTQPTDFNDLMLLTGVDEVKSQTDKALNQLEKKVRQASLPEGFFIANLKVMYRNPYEENAETIQVCSLLEVVGISRDKQNQNWGRVLKFFDVDGHEHTWSMPMDMLSGDGKELRAELLNQGLMLGSHPKAKNLLKTLIQDSEQSKRFVNVPQVGWHDDVYVLPDRMIGKAEEEYVLQSNGSVDIDYSKQGDLQEWQDSISKYCQGNSRLILAMSTAFAAPLVSQCSIESGGIHFMGGSSLGKTTALLVAGSVWGSHKRLKKWRATGNALESVSAMSNDCLLCLDELAEISPKEAGATAYMLANGQGKQRANKMGGSRKVQTWKLLFLSTGEVSLATHMSEGGQRTRAGQAVRMMEVPADTEKFGLFEKLYEFESGAQMSEYFKKQTELVYGSAGMAFLEEFVSNREKAIAFVEEAMLAFKNQYFPKGYESGQVYRVFTRFAFIAAVGELATQMGITGWQQGEAFQAGFTCFGAWLSNYGGDVCAEVDTALSEVRRFIELHGDSRFTDIDKTTDNSRTINRAGYKKREGNDVVYYFSVEVFRKEVCEGLDYRNVAKILRDHEHLLHETGRLTQKTPVLEDGRRVSAYAVKSSILET